MDRSTVSATDRFIFSIGAIHRSSPVSFRSFCAFRLRSLRWSVHAVLRTSADIHWMVRFRDKKHHGYEQDPSPDEEDIERPAPMAAVRLTCLWRTTITYQVVKSLMKPPTLHQSVSDG